MRLSLSGEQLNTILGSMEDGHVTAGDTGARRPVHTVYGGAHLFTAGTTRKLGAVALGMMDEYAPDFCAFARAVGLPDAGRLPAGSKAAAALEKKVARNPDASGPAALAWKVHRRVRGKLQREPVEDYRVDFEDGFGPRSGEEEDDAAVRMAGEMAKGMTEGSLPPFVGIRIRALAPPTAARAARTLDLFLTALAEKTGGKLPPEFLVALPKVTSPDQVETLATLLGRLERTLGFQEGSVKIEIMVETPLALVNREGRLALPLMRTAAGGRLAAAHLGAYDLTAALHVAAPEQHLGHPACDTARQLMQLAFAGTGVRVVDGVSAVLPVPPHRPKGAGKLTVRQRGANREAVLGAWRAGWDDVTRALGLGIFQGWDLHPGQLPVRYAATYAFFLRDLDATAERLAAFVDRAARAVVRNTLFDDAATGQGMLNFFLRGLACGALTTEEAARAGLSPEELRMGSFAAILEHRASHR